MSPREAFALRDYLGSELKGRTISDARQVASLTDILGETCLADGPASLITIEDDAGYIVKLSKAEQKLEVWQTATEALIMAAEDRGPPMNARIGVLRALNRNVQRVFNLDRKDTRWRKRKLKRDE